MPFTAAVVQASPVVFDRERTLDKIGDLTADAARQGAKLVVFPEAFVSSYPKGLDFGARVGGRSPEGREYFKRYWDSAVDIPGPGNRPAGDHRGRSRCVPGRRHHRTRQRDTLLHCGLLRRRRQLPRQTPQADAHRHGANHLGVR